MSSMRIECIITQRIANAIKAIVVYETPHGSRLNGSGRTLGNQGDLMPIELGSFDVIIGIGWLTRSDGYASIVDCEQRAELFGSIGMLELDNMRVRGIKELTKPLRVRVLVMTIHSSLLPQMHEAQVEAIEKENFKDKNLHGMGKEFETRLNETLFIRSKSWLPCFRDLRELIRNESHKSNYFNHPRSDKIFQNLKKLYRWPDMEASITTYVSKCLTCLRMRDDYQRPLGFQVRYKVMLKVSPRKRVIHFGKRGKLNPRYIGPFKILAKVGTVAYRLEFLQQTSGVHSTLLVSNLKECSSKETLVIPLDEIQIKDKL
nr:putative reverse transcriptase domain-containing protein [Tanacetum cinerariifolium]